MRAAEVKRRDNVRQIPLAHVKTTVTLEGVCGERGARRMPVHPRRSPLDPCGRVGCIAARVACAAVIMFRAGWRRKVDCATACCILAWLKYKTKGHLMTAGVQNHGKRREHRRQELRDGSRSGVQCRIVM